LWPSADVNSYATKHASEPLEFAFFFAFSKMRAQYFNIVFGLDETSSIQNTAPRQAYKQSSFRIILYIAREMEKTPKQQRRK
jgi:hypothetical protein